MGKSTENYARKKELILSVAKGLFLENGYVATSMDTVAKEADVTKQTVYRYFPSKEELFAAVMKGMREKRSGYTFGSRGILEELISFAEEFIAAHMEEERLNLFKLVLAEGSADSLIGKIFREVNQNRRKKPLVDYFRDRVGLKEPERCADIFCSMLLYSRNQVLLGVRQIPDQEEIKDMAETTVSIFVNGVLSL